MSETKVKKKSTFTSWRLEIAMIVFFVAIMWGQSERAPMWMDEYVFYRLASKLPSYSTSADWFFKDRPDMLVPTVEWVGLNREEAFHLTYDTPIYPHSPLPVAIVWPFVKGLNWMADKGVFEHLEQQKGMTEDGLRDTSLVQVESITRLLRIIPMFLFALSMWLIYQMLKRKIGQTAILFVLPVSAGANMLLGAYLFYWDVFMMFFFVLTLYLMETRPNDKWHYLTACLLVNTKIYIGIWFLIPLILKERKLIWAAFSYLPFYLATIWVTGDPLYVVTHYLNQMPIHNFAYTLWHGFWQSANTLIALGMPFYVLMCLPILLFFKKYPVYAVYWVMTMLYAWGAGLGITHASTMVYAGAIVWPFVAHEWRVMERLQKWLNPKKKAIA